MRSYGLVFAPLLGLCLLQAQSAQPNPFEDVPNPSEPPAPAVSGFTIEAIEFRSTRPLSQAVLRAVIASRVGGAYDIATLRRDAQVLRNTQRFSAVVLQTEPGRAGAVVRFIVAERPLIQALDYEGDDTVTRAEILRRFGERKINVRPEALLNEDELGRAAMTIQELVAEKGRPNIAVTSVVEPTGPALVWPSPTVKVIFTVADKQ
jgi:outer membrane protein assembly factor BamA